MSAITEQLLQDILNELAAQRGSRGGGDNNNSPNTIIGKLAAGAAAAAEGVMKLAATAQSGSAGLSEVMAIVPKLPGPLGVFNTALTFAASVMEKNIATQQELSKSGATFGGSLIDMRAAAAGAYLSLDQFSGVVKNNSDIFRTMGGNVQSGVDQFAKIQKTLLKPGSETANMLATLGVGSEEAAELTASYMRSQGSMNKQELQDTKAVVASVANYAGELTVLSELTGKSRQAIQEKMKEEASEAQWAQAMAEMDVDKAAKANEGLLKASLQGQGAIDYFKAKMMGFPPMTEAGRLFAATQRAGTAALDKYVSVANNASITTSEASKQNRAALAKSIADGAGDMNKMRTVLMASGLSGSALSKTLADAQKLQTSFMKDNKMMSEQEIAAKLEKMDADTKQTESAAASGRQLQQMMQDLTNTILAKIMPALNILLSAFVKGADYLFKLLIPALDAIDFTPMIEFFKTIIKRIDWASMGETLSGILSTAAKVLSNIATYLEPVFTQITQVLNSMMPKIMPIIDDISVILNTVVTRMSDIFGVVFKMIDRAFQIVAPLLGPIIDGITMVIGGFIDRIGGIIKVVKGILTGDFGEIATGLKMIVGGFFDKIFGIIKIIKDLLVGSVRFVWNALTGGVPESEKPAAPKTKEPVTPEKTVETPATEVPKRAMGGPVQKNMPTLVGERGIELFLPPQDGQIVSNAALTAAQSSKSQTPSQIAASESSTTNETATAKRTMQNIEIKSLQTEVQTLNKTMMDILRYIKDTAENTRQNVNATKSLDGNLFARP